MEQEPLSAEAGPAALLEEAFDEFGGNVRVWALAVYSGWSAADLDDITAEVFAVLYRLLYGVNDESHGELDRRRFRDRMQLGAFLRATTRNVARNHYRALTRRFQREVELDPTDRSPTNLPLTAGACAVERAEFERELLECLRALDPEQRIAYGHFLQGTPRAKAAAAMGLSERAYRTKLDHAQRTVHSRLRRKGFIAP